MLDGMPPVLCVTVTSTPAFTRCAPSPDRRDTSSFASTAVEYVTLVPPMNPPKLKVWTAGVVELERDAEGTTTEPLAAGSPDSIPDLVQLALTRASFTQAPAWDVSEMNARLPCDRNEPVDVTVESGSAKPDDRNSDEFAESVSVLCSFGVKS